MPAKYQKIGPFDQRKRSYRCEACTRSHLKVPIHDRAGFLLADSHDSVLEASAVVTALDDCYHVNILQPQCHRFNLLNVPSRPRTHPIL